MPETPDIFLVLHEDHEQIRDLMESLMPRMELRDSTRLFHELKISLEAHVEAEEQVVYHVARDIAEAEFVVREAKVDHAEIRELLEELSGMQYGDAKWDSTFFELRHLVSQHFEAEETELFDRMRSSLDRGQRRSLAKEYKAVKARLDYGLAA